MMIDALWITLLGMGITFTAILLLWGMMAGLTALPFKDKDGSDSPEPAVAVDENPRAKAAAVAVAIALAEQELSSARPLSAPPTALVSAWQLSTRSRQLYERGKQRRR
jgi:Na+-transporting methylmalonyl-CoA/oxaloacetate decarboxylase gamma subunit